MNEKLKEQLVSAGWSFLGGALLVLISSLDTIDVNHLDKAVIVGVMFAMVRGGLKAMWTLISNWNNNGN